MHVDADSIVSTTIVCMEIEAERRAAARKSTRRMEIARRPVREVKKPVREVKKGGIASWCGRWLLNALGLRKTSSV
jgi:hypothetical protein